LKKTAIYKIIKKVKVGGDTSDQRHLNPKKTQRTADNIAAIDTAIKKDGRLTIAELAAATGATNGPVHAILKEELGLEKKSARWVPKLLNDLQKQERVRVCTNFVAAVP